MELFERIKKVIDESGATLADVSQRTGIKLDRLRNLSRGIAKKIERSEALRIRNAFHYREIWLLEGRGPAKLTPDEIKTLPALTALSQSVEDVKELDLPSEVARQLQHVLSLWRMRDERGLCDLFKREVAAAPTQQDEYVYVPRYAVTASAGHGALVDDESVVDYLAFKRDWVVRSLGLDPKFLVLVQSGGDSMSPTIENGELLLVDTRPVQRGDDIFLLNLAGALLVKRLQMRVGGAIDIISDNPRYPTVSVAGDETAQLILIGRIAWHFRKM